MKKVQDECYFSVSKPAAQIRERHRASRMKALLAQIPCYTVQARLRLEMAGQEGELHHWLSLYDEFNQFPARLIDALDHDR